MIKISQEPIQAGAPDNAGIIFNLKTFLPQLKNILDDAQSTF